MNYNIVQGRDPLTYVRSALTYLKYMHKFVPNSLDYVSYKYGRLVSQNNKKLNIAR